MPGFPLPTQDVASAGFRAEPIERLVKLIEEHIREDRYPGCQIALARNGRLVLDRSFGDARTRPERKRATSDTLWLLYSNTKVVTAAALWILAERGACGFGDRIADHLPEFARNGKQDITILQLITHQAGFPNAAVPEEAWGDHAKLRDIVAGFTLEWTPGSRLSYHPTAAHWVAAVLIEALSGEDFRDFIRNNLIAPLGLGADIFVGLPESETPRAADMHEPLQSGDGMQPLAANNRPEWRRAGVPGAGGYATARGMAAFYQMMLAGGTLGGTRILSPRTLAFAIRNHTGDRIDEYMGMPMHRGLGPHLRGTSERIRGLGSFASPRVFGHGGVGSSYCWGDPDSGTSFAYLTNNRVPDPWHSRRLDIVSNFVHAAIL
ncbi:MAG: beta-lactamase family protein [Alphaproteobacteria bacterium]|nr:beta-lactamase family protein [Alphaproteobacteria bacterium]